MNSLDDFDFLTLAAMASPVYVGLCLLMCGACLWRVWLLIATGGSDRADRPAASKKAVKGRPVDDVAEWVLPPATASPSRVEVGRRLPDYAGCLLEGWRK